MGFSFLGGSLMSNSYGFGYTYVCPCGTAIQTVNGLDYEDQLTVIQTMVDDHREEHRAQYEVLLIQDAMDDVPPSY
jgi:hypothetical protein